MSKPTPLDSGRPTRSQRRPLAPWVSYPVVGLAVFGLVATLFSGTAGTRSREVAARAVCASNLHQIGLAISVYAQAHGGAYPDSLATLVREVPGLAPGCLVCRDSTDTPATGPTTRAVADAVAAGGHCSCSYVGSGLTVATATPTTVVAYDSVPRHSKQSNLLYGDGHAAWGNVPAGAGPTPPKP